MINLGIDKIKDIYMGVDGVNKVYLGTDLIWEKGTIMSFWVTIASSTSPFASDISISSRDVDMTIGKTILSVKIGNLKEISQEHIKPIAHPKKISFKKPLDELTGNNDWITQGTKVRIQYLGTKPIWDENKIRTTSWMTESNLSHFSTSVTVSDYDIAGQLYGKYIIDLTIGDYGKIGIVRSFNPLGNLIIDFGGSLDELLGVKDFIPRGTKITVRYKQE